MKAVIFEKFGDTPTIETVPDPAPTPDGVVVKVEATGVCRSDWHGWMGHDPGIRLPHVPGHELAGTVAAIGSAVRQWRIGDRVTVPFGCGCGHCAECNSGNHQVCERQFQPGFTHWGSFAEYVALGFADANLVRLPDDMDFATASSLGCRFTTAFRAIVDQGRVTPGEWVAVHGCGGVGLSAIMIASAIGANVVGVDIAPDKLENARRVGAAATIDASATDNVVNALKAVTGGGAHVSVDALGHPATCANSIACLRRRGRHVQVGLLLADQARPQIPMDRVIAYELEIRGSHGMQAFRYRALLDMIQGGKVRPQELIGRKMALEDAPAALIAMADFQATGISVITSF